MALRPDHLLELVVRPALATIAHVSRWAASVEAEQLLMGTAAQESANFTCLRQLAHADGRRGPALGLWQMEPATHDDIWLNYLKFRRFLWQSVAAEAVSGATPCRYEPNEIAEADGPEWWPDADEMAWNLRYAALMARVHYLRVPKPLPKVGDVEAMARYWDTHYNRNPNAGTPEEFVGAWHRNGLTALWS